MFINLKIKSKNKVSLIQFLQFFLLVNRYRNLSLKTNSKFINNLKQKKIVTVLKSPHVNKKSQEQFEFNLKSKQICLKSGQVFKLIVLIKNLQKISGFDIKILVKFAFYSNAAIVTKKIHPKKYQIKKCKIKYLYLLKKYLGLFEVYGKSKFSFR